MKRTYNCYSHDLSDSDSFDDSSSTSTTEDFSSPLKKQNTTYTKNETKTVTENLDNIKNNDTSNNNIKFPENNKKMDECSILCATLYMFKYGDDNGSKKICEIIVNEKLLQQSDLDTLLINACKYERLNTLTYLLESPVEFEYVTFYLSFLMVGINGNMELAKLLMKYISNFEHLKYSKLGALDMADYYGNNKLCEYLNSE